jgi:hypothetical protein
LDVLVGAAPVAVPVPELEGTTVAEREVVAGAVADEMADDTDAETEDRTELTDEDAEATLEDTADVVAGAELVGSAEEEAAEVGAAVPLVTEADWPRQLESELP